MPNFLAVCQEGEGLALVDANDIEIILQYSAINCFDLIYSDEQYITTASNGIGKYVVDGEY